MKLIIFGRSGMLGSRVMREAERRQHQVAAPLHRDCDIAASMDLEQLLASTGRPDAILNCAGRRPGSDFFSMVRANVMGPHNLAELGIPLVHMSTDCVFSGRRKGMRGSQEDPDPIDAYGRSKLLGEPSGPHVLVVRGSFIGPDHGFFRWVLDAKGQVKAWTKAYWNGGTVQRMAEYLISFAEEERTGLCHVAAAEAVSKAWMVEYLAEALDLRFSIELTAGPVIYRALEPDVELPPVKEALDELVRGDQ